MTPRQDQFISEYAVSRNATQAAIKAGYSARTARQTGSENLTKPDIQAAVAQYESEAAERLAVTRERVLAELEQAIDVAREQRNPMAQIAGWREIAKICGYYAPERHQMKVSVNDSKLRSMLEGMTDAELFALASPGTD